MAYLPLSTANLPDPGIDPADDASPKDHFNILGWQGRSSVGTSSYTGLGFQPDFTWIKCRNTAHHHYLVDGLRGPNNVLSSNLIAAEPAFTPDEFVSFDSDGITVEFASGGGRTNYSSDGPYISWNWKANGSGVSNTDGSITSTVSANTTSGFSIVSWEPAATAGTVGHGLNQKPEFIIIKDRDAALLWLVYHEATGTQGYLALNATDGFTPNSTTFTTAPTDEVFDAGSGVITGNGYTNMIAYCFHSVEGFSKFGSYVGNGSADGPFVYTGFRPAFVMIKATSGTESWNIVDDARNTYNGAKSLLYPNLSNAEANATNGIDLLSNGFKLRDNIGNYNSSGVTYIYMAFAENPFKYSTAR